MEKEKLFKEFPPVSAQSWKEKIITDLKGADFEKKLVWKTGEGFDLQPFYTESDLAKLGNLEVCPGDFPFLRGKNIASNKWLVRQDIVVDNIEKANAKALDIRLKGIDSFSFGLKKENAPTPEEIELLLKNIRLDLMEINFETDYPLETIEIIDQLAIKYNRDLEKVSGSLSFDPLGTYSTTGKFNAGYDEDFSMLTKLVKASETLPNYQVITVDGAQFHNAGSGIVSQLAFTLAKGANYLTYLTDEGFDIDRAAPKLRFQFAVGSNYFMEIAKFRAARYLWANIVNAYGLNDAANGAMFIHCTNSTWNKTLYDPYVNMLRVTTETMSSLLGGVDSMTVLPFNAVFEKPNDFSERIARNLQLLLKGESYFDKVNDPAAGSYYIEELTANIIDQAWRLFLEIDEMGGYFEAFKKGFITKMINEESEARDKAIAQGKRSVLGTNKYPNINEHLGQYTGPDLEAASDTDKLNLYRGAMAFEKLRLKTDQYAMEKQRPVVWMFTYGNLAMRNARAQFAANFFGCAGFEIVNNDGFKNIASGIEAAKKAKPQIVVVCSSDDEYNGNIQTIINELGKETIVVLAGYPAALLEELNKSGFRNFIHVRSNMLEELKRYQLMLNIQ